MAQEIPGSSFKCNEIQIVQLNGEGKTESNGSTDSWLIDVKRTFITPHKIWQLSTKVCFYRVPKGITDWKPEVYAPSLISLGPYHHRKNPQLIKMDQYKVEAIHRMLARLTIDVNDLIEEVQKLESVIRECYAEPIEWDGQTLSWMLTMDACFILEFFRSSAKSTRESDINCFSLVFQSADGYNCMFGEILKDILKLENQIPLCILMSLLQLECKTREKATTELAKWLSTSSYFDGSPFSCFSVSETESKLKEHMEKNPPPCHLLDLSRMIIKDVLVYPRPQSATDLKSNESPQLPGHTLSIPCSLLQGAGIKFQPGKIGFEKRWFQNSTLFLPRITMDGSTETLLRNLLAYEECQRCSLSPQETLISHNVRIIKDLIDSGKDVSILKKSDIILGAAFSDEDTARMFKLIMKGLLIDQGDEVRKVLRGVRDHYQSQWTVWMSQFKEEYFSKPWYAISLLAALLLLSMTAVQTVYSVKK